MMLSLIASSLWVTAVPTAEPTVVAVCYLQEIDLAKTQASPDGAMALSGPSRLLLIAFPNGGSGQEAINKLKIHDPTNILEGYRFSILDRSDAGKFELVVNQAGAPSNRILSVQEGEVDTPQIAYFLRIEGGNTRSAMGGGCQRVITNDPDAEWQDKITFRGSIDQ